MTNEELFNKCKTIEELKEDYNRFIDDYGLLCNDFVDVCEENIKLKVEIEKLKQNIIDSTNETYTMQKLDHELLTKEIEQLQSVNAKLCEEIAKLKRFKQYFDELYGTGLEVANWHLNGDLEPLDNFIDSANDYMKEKENN